MHTEQTSIQEFQAGHGGADVLAKPLVAVGYAPKAYRGVSVRALTGNTLSIFVGPPGVTVANGYELVAGAELEIPVDCASKIYVVATPAGNSSQVITVARGVAGDTFTLTFEGQTTAPIALGALAATVQTALLALSNVGTGNLSVAGNAGGPYTVSFIGARVKRDFLLMTGVGAGPNEKQEIVVTLALSGDKMILTYGADSTSPLDFDASAAQVEAALNALSTLGAGSVSVTDSRTGWYVEFLIPPETDVGAITGVCSKNEKQHVSLDSDVTGGTFTLTYSGQTTGAIPFDASAVALAAALNALSNITPDGVTVTKGVNTWEVEFVNALAITDVATMTANGAALTGAATTATKTVAVVETLKGEAAVNEKQTITVTDATGGTFTLTFGDQTTSALAYNVSTANMATALKALSNIEADEVAVTGDPGAWVVEFLSAKAATDVDRLVADGAALTGALNTVTVVEDVKGNAAVNEKQTVTLSEDVTGGTFTITYIDQETAALDFDSTVGEVKAALEALSNVGTDNVVVTGVAGAWIVEFVGDLAASDIAALTTDDTNLVGDTTTTTVSETRKGEAAVNEEQAITLDAAVTGGTFTITYGGETTAAIDFDASANDVENALEALINIGDSDVSVTGVAGAWVVRFVTTLAATDVNLMTVDASALTGALNVPVVEETHKGNAAVNEIQTINLAQTATGGTFTVTYAGQTTSALAYNVSTANMATALKALSNIENDEVVVSGVPGAWIVTFAGAKAATDIAAMTGTGTNLIGALNVIVPTEVVKGNEATVTVTETQKGGAPCVVSATQTNASAGSCYSWISC